ncbi:Squalene--hopene cyclase [Polystyrenella longa]|uniref:Squalene--hopene cyclase n=1 Tax=Polystyrenella longa TaxID=2528007 RepID=A0A518CRK0_9PLAN|nr:prenyltransferase/squalene oxidase repeat-containing protein [Polystyrenella longa]QDU81849.1 Squalene--hopene cyclase [Polystyrenella longa]
MPDSFDQSRLRSAYIKAQEQLLQERTLQGWWEGGLSTSALATATAVVALEMVQRQLPNRDDQYQELITNGLRWLAEHQNDDGGWGDTVKSFSNISTSMLARAALEATGTTDKYASEVKQADAYIKRIGGVKAVIRRYGKDKTFSVPILTQCALADQVDWKQIPSLPFELACLPHRFYKTVKLPVVSYALPALIAIGQVRYHFARPWNPLTRIIRKLSRQRTLDKLVTLQPESGGFLEATPLTSFVTMSLAAMGQHEHPVVKKGVQFLVDSVRPDGSWPIDTNLATWVTTLSTNAVEGDVPEESRDTVLKFLLDQQYQTVHPYTNADPGGWAWTDLTGGVPDADDSPGAILAILNLNQTTNFKHDTEIRQSADLGVQWLLDIQNRDGGWPTFCKGWGALPFDRSSPDLTAHTLRALFRYQGTYADLWQSEADTRQLEKVENAIERGFGFLRRIQRTNGSWVPLWFGNQHADDEENPLYGTARVLAAWFELGRGEAVEAQRGLNWISNSQNESGGWSGQPGLPDSVEETALALEMLVVGNGSPEKIERGLDWLCSAVESERYRNPSPIGFYFAKLWYFERLYPLIFTVSALHRACHRFGISTSNR